MEDFFAKNTDNGNEDSEEKLNNLNNNNTAENKSKTKPKKLKMKNIILPPMDFVKAKQYLGIKTSATLEVYPIFSCLIPFLKIL